MQQVLESIFKLCITFLCWQVYTVLYAVMNQSESKINTVFCRHMIFYCIGALFLVAVDFMGHLEITSTALQIIKGPIKCRC